MKKVLSILILTSIISCKKDENKDKDEQFNLKGSKNYSLIFDNATDSENNSYLTVLIDQYQGMGENLKVSKFRNGDTITQSRNIKEWIYNSKLNKPTWCYYNFNESFNEKYGKLYNYYAVNDKRGLAPVGWHISSKKELIKFNKDYGTGNLIFINNKVINSKEIGVLGGYFSFSKNNHDAGPLTSFDGIVGSWWCSEEVSKNDAVSMEISSFKTPATDSSFLRFYQSNKKDGLSVRCIKDY